MPQLHDPARAFIPYPDSPVPHAGTGALSGLTFAVKDLFDVAGYPTGGGNPFVLARSGIKTRTAPTVQRLLDAGARFVGKVVTDEFAFSMNGSNIHFGAPVNGAAPDRISGGSSSGSAAAVSHRLVDFALGTDTGGSVRAPASHCGLYGIRPTHGRVSLEGVMDLSPSLDTCGWFARDVATFTRVAEVLLGADSHPLAGAIRLLKPDDMWSLLAEPVRAAHAEGLSRLAGGLQALTVGRDGNLGSVEVAPGGIDGLYWAFRYIQGREAWNSDGDLIQRYQPPMGPDVAGRFAWSSAVTDEQFADATRTREQFRRRLTELLGDDGVLVLPTMPDIAPLRNEGDAALEAYRAQAVQLLCLAGLAGFPQVSLPLGRREGAPLGLSLLGPAGSDLGLVRLAGRIQPPG
jgi:amidase